MESSGKLFSRLAVATLILGGSGAIVGGMTLGAAAAFYFMASVLEHLEYLSDKMEELGDGQAKMLQVAERQDPAASLNKEG